MNLKQLQKKMFPSFHILKQKKYLNDRGYYHVNVTLAPLGASPTKDIQKYCPYYRHFLLKSCAPTGRSIQRKIVTIL